MITEEKQQAQLAELKMEELLEAARQEAGLTDFGDEHFLEPLAKLLECAAKEVDFHEQGFGTFKFFVQRGLVNRLRFEDDLKKHPEILDEDVSDPIIIIGLGRSGTTKTQKMLSVPDSVQSTTFWRLWNVAPFPNAKPGEPDSRIEAANFSSLMTEGNEQLEAAHRMTHTEVEEDGLLYHMTFEDWMWSVLTPTDSFYDWLMPRSHLKAYRYVKSLFQYMQWQDGGKRNRPWIIKSIAHTANMDALLDCYPNATLVHCHRDPLQTITSWSKFQADMWDLQSNPMDPKISGERSLKYYKLAMDRYLEARERLNLDDRIVDIQYTDVRENPMKVMREIYDRAGITMSPEAEKSMIAWDTENEQGKFGKHVYRMEDYGLTPEIINQTFEQYIERFIVR